jgi:hypothetical protein
MTDLSYFIGVDHREQDAIRVATQSAKAYASKPLPIYYLDHLDLRQRAWFDRPWRISEEGVMYDERDGKPFTTQFAHTRFLAPLLAKASGHTGWALFTDCDWLWLADPWKILERADPTKTALVVKHDYQPTTSIKMDGQPQTRYNRKLWSALTLWNLSSEKLPTFEMVNNSAGGWLHAFGWLKDSDIGELPEEWHWCPNISPTTKAALDLEANNKVSPISAVHFTLGVPGMPDREPTPFDDFYKNELKEYYRRHEV